MEGASASELRSGPGHVEGSAQIGAKGNAVILGRRERFGGPFGRLGEVEEGATIVVKTRDGDVRLYQVGSVERVKGSSRAPVETTDKERLTLVTAGHGLVPDGRLMVTATAKDGSTAPEPTPTPAPTSRSAAMDERPADPVPGGLLVWAVIAGLLAVLLVVGRRVRRRYSTGVTVVALAPVGGVARRDAAVHGRHRSSFDVVNADWRTRSGCTRSGPTKVKATSRCDSGER